MRFVILVVSINLGDINIYWWHLTSLKVSVELQSVAKIDHTIGVTKQVIEYSWSLEGSREIVVASASYVQL